MDSSEKKFNLQVTEARLTRDTATFGSMDPFVILNYNGVLYKTKIAKSGGKTPKWEQDFEVPY